MTDSAVLDKLEIGTHIHQWTLLELPISAHDKVRCRCTCGTVQLLIFSTFARGQSCRCRSCAIKSRPKKYGEPIRGSSYERLYWIWSGMKARCRAVDERHGQYYGLRGIKVSSEWLDNFPAFREWALVNGYRDDLTIDRIDSNGNYEPSNCRWANDFIQGRNKRNNHLVTAFGETKSLIEWSEDARCAVKFSTLWRRLVTGWPSETAITTPTWHPGCRKFRQRGCE